MTQAEKETIVVFCREFTQAFYRIFGKMIIIDPDLLAHQVENDKHFDQKNIPVRDHNDLHPDECLDGIDSFSRLLPMSPDGQG